MPYGFPNEREERVSPLCENKELLNVRNWSEPAA